jgi:hypothetical protein
MYRECVSCSHIGQLESNTHEIWRSHFSVFFFLSSGTSTIQVSLLAIITICPTTSTSWRYRKTSARWKSLE